MSGSVHSLNFRLLNDWFASNYTDSTKHYTEYCTIGLEVQTIVRKFSTVLVLVLVRNTVHLLVCELNYCTSGEGCTSEQTLSLFAHDLYVIGTQEQPPSLSERDWIAKLKAAITSYLNVGFHLVCYSACSFLLFIRFMLPILCLSSYDALTCFRSLALQTDLLELRFSLNPSFTTELATWSCIILNV